MENKESSVSIVELEKELATKETIQKQIENALQQILGQITCLRTIIRKAKGEDKPEENLQKENTN